MWPSLEAISDCSTTIDIDIGRTQVFVIDLYSISDVSISVNTNARMLNLRRLAQLEARQFDAHRVAESQCWTQLLQKAMQVGGTSLVWPLQSFGNRAAKQSVRPRQIPRQVLNFERSESSFSWAHRDRSKHQPQTLPSRVASAVLDT